MSRIDCRRLIKISSLLIPAIALLLVYEYLAGYSRLMGDDYCLLYFSRRFGLFRSMWYWYLNWHGAFAISFIDGLLIYFGEKWLWIAIPFTLVLWFAVITFSYTKLLKNNGHWRINLLTSLALASSAIMVTVIWSPNIQQTFFWWSGLRKYITPLIISSFLVGLYIIFLETRPGKLKSAFWRVIFFGLAFINGGVNETYSPAFVALFIFIISFQLVFNGRAVFREATFKILVAGLMGAVLALILMAIAPGNSIRQEQLPDPPNLLALLSLASRGYLRFYQFIFNSLALACALFGTLIGAMILGVDFEIRYQPGGKEIGFVVLAGLVIPYVCFLPTAYAFSEPLLARTVVLPAFIAVAFFQYAALLSGNWLQKRYAYIDWQGASIPLVIMVLVLMSIAGWLNGNYLLGLKNGPIEYAQKWDQSFALIMQAKQAGEEQVVIPVRTNWGGVFEPRDNPEFYLNWCMSEFYGIQIIAVEAVGE